MQRLLSFGITILVWSTMMADLAHASTATGVSVGELKCEYRVDPLGIDVTAPRLSWTLESEERGQIQTAYQVLVAGTDDALSQDTGDLWDSGRVDSDQSVHVVYAGRPLKSRESRHATTCPSSLSAARSRRRNGR